MTQKKQEQAKAGSGVVRSESEADSVVDFNFRFVLSVVLIREECEKREGNAL